MAQEDKELLLKDLCGRLPYKVKCKCLHDNVAIPSCIDVEDEGLENIYYPGNDEWERITNCKPYLRPMSSMTEEERTEYFLLSHRDNDREDNIILIDEASALIDWLNAHHFDYRGLIEKGLALEAPKGMYEY